MKKGRQIVYSKYFPLGYNVSIFPLAVYSSDVIVQIVDARNPLLFRCEDLESYVLEVDANKTNVLLVNKADYLTEKQRLAWLAFDHCCDSSVKAGEKDTPFHQRQFQQ